MPTLRETIASAMDTSGFDPDSPTGLSDVDLPSAGDGPAAGLDGSDVTTDTSVVSGLVDGDHGVDSEGDIPTDYYGLDLSDLSPESLKAVTTRLQEQDKLIQQEKRRNAELAREEEPTAVAPEPTTDDIMEALGYDKGDPMYDVKAEVAGPLATRLVQMEAAFSQFVQQQQLERLADHWDGTLDYMESEYGKLPMDREEVYEYAADNGISDPRDAYNRIAVPGRKRMSAEAEKARAEALRNAKRGIGTPRPSTGDAGPSEPEGRLSPRESMILAAKQTGLDWGDALRATR